ncbi:fructose-bisphosphate aldolase class I [Guyparkeria halophila]|uniref:Probable fructose-bisphosphate aldolase class 1 n=1 Tax=Guyparkeria halophila TaxID=47960 RepID=A0A6I6CWE2_9GAMM|nr:class I fructose-bisphosphate aldolase [Guyparkeria halophila]QGT78696.1 fructose-bisphosphate aldolase class I [Guyparkeria halophila]
MTTYRPEKADELIQTAKAMVAPGKGILAIDESNGTCNKRFEAVGIEPTEQKRREYRELLLTTPNLEEYVSGAILYDETIRQTTGDGKSFIDVMRERGQVVGIKVDTGAKPLAGSDGEKVTEGLDGLRERLAEYYEMGARFAKWRAVIAIDTAKGLPTRGCIEANAHALARYAALCQEAGVVPIIEPEVLIDGDHDITTCERVTEEELNEVFRQLYHQNVMLEGVILKTSMVISGKGASNRAGVDEVADRTVETLRRTVPAALGGVVFLSGGQGVEESTAHLNAMHVRHADRLPWPLTFSYARAIQGPALNYWKGEPGNVAEAQQRALTRAKYNGLASLGKYSEDMESA